MGTISFRGGGRSENLVGRTEVFYIDGVHTDFTFNSTKIGMGQITPPGPTALIQFRFIEGLTI